REVLLAVGGELVNPLPTPRPGSRRRFERALFGDPAGLGTLAQGRIERSVRESPKCAEQGREALAEFIAVQRALVEQLEDGDLQHATGSYLELMYQHDTSARHVG